LRSKCSISRWPFNAVTIYAPHPCDMIVFCRKDGRLSPRFTFCS
jgi:hypothetical protein